MKNLFAVLLMNVFVFFCLSTSYCQVKTDFKTKLDRIKAEMAKPPVSSTPTKKPNSNAKISIGLSKEQVLDLLGEPCFKAPEYWKYDLFAVVSFDKNGLVSDWDGFPYKSPKGLERASVQPSTPRTTYTPTTEATPKSGAKASPAKTEKFKFCPNCGKKAGKGDNYCSKCSSSLIKDSVEAPVAVAEKEEVAPQKQESFEYKYVFYDEYELINPYNPNLEDRLNALGKEGWEVMSQRKAKDDIKGWGIEISLKRKKL